MKKIKVSETTGPALDWLVAKCKGKDVAISDIYPNGTRSVVIYYGKDENGFIDGRSYCPSNYWSDGGPIIEREKISLDALTGYSDPMWMANEFDYEDLRCRMYGPTPLIAAMRCYVTSKLGEEVKIPEELVD